MKKGENAEMIFRHFTPQKSEDEERGKKPEYCTRQFVTINCILFSWEGIFSWELKAALYAAEKTDIVS